MANIELNVDLKALQAVGRALRAEEDGALLRKDLVAELKLAVQPGVSEVRGKLQAIPHSTAADPSPALGSYLASRVRPQVRLSGRRTGVAVRIAKTPNLRGFAMAARRLNRTHWRHKVFGRDVWVEQQSPITGFFDETLRAGKSRYRDAVIAAVEKMSHRIARRGL